MRTSRFLKLRKKILPLGLGLCVLALHNVARADVINRLGWQDTRPKIGDLHRVYAGIGLTNDFVHVNADMPTPYGDVYVKAGQYFNNGKGVAVQAGWRYPYAYTGVDQNGYYLGAFAGHVDGVLVDNTHKNRLGGGLELSYLMLNRSRMASFSVGIGAGQEVKSSTGVLIKKVEPMVFFGASVGFGLF